MEIQVGHYYQDRKSRTVKVLAREQKQMRPLTEQFLANLNACKVNAADDDRERVVPVDCFRCWYGGEEEDYYVTLTGQACQAYKLVSGEALRYAFPLSERHDEADLVNEVSLRNEEKRRFSENKPFHVEQYIVLSLRIWARSADDTHDQLPPINAIEEALRPLLTSSTIEIEEISYDYDQGEIEEEDNEDVETDQYDDRNVPRDIDPIRYE